MVSKIILPDGNRKKLRAHFSCHLFGFFFLVVVAAVEGESKGTDGIATMQSSEAEGSTGIQTSAEIATDGHVCAKAQAHRFLQRVTKFRGIVRVGALRQSALCPGIIEIPVLIDLDVPVGRKHIGARRYLEDSFVECAHLMAADVERVGDGLSIPASGHARGKE